VIRANPTASDADVADLDPPAMVALEAQGIYGRAAWVLTVLLASESLLPQSFDMAVGYDRARGPWWRVRPHPQPGMASPRLAPD
jgi:hypothetical protein